MFRDHDVLTAGLTSRLDSIGALKAMQDAGAHHSLVGIEWLIDVPLDAHKPHPGTLDSYDGSRRSRRPRTGERLWRNFENIQIR